MVLLVIGHSLMAEDALQPVPMSPEDHRMMVQEQIELETHQRCQLKARALYQSLNDNDRASLQSFSALHRDSVAASSPLLKLIQDGRFNEAEAVVRGDYTVDDKRAAWFVKFTAYANDVAAACPKERGADGTKQPK
jgi:hypothetical protein